MKKVWYPVFMLLFLFASCGGEKAVVTKYYTIEAPDLIKADSLIDTAKVVKELCEIKDVFVYSAFASRRIVNRSESNEITYYAYHEWAVRPEEYLTQVLLDYFDQQNTFEGVALRYWEVVPKYKMETTVFQLEIVQKKSKLSAHLKLEFKIIEVEKQRTVVAYRADKEKIVKKKEMNLLAKAMSELYFEAMGEFNDKIVEKLAKVSN